MHAVRKAEMLSNLRVNLVSLLVLLLARNFRD